MTDYLGPLTLGTSGTYQLASWASGDGSASVEVIVQTATAATLTAAIEALVAQLNAGNTYAHSFPGTTTPVAYTVTGVAGVSVDEDAGPLAFWASVKFTLALSANPAGALTTLYSAQHVDTPASVSLATLLGSQPTALDVTVDDDAGTDMHSVMCALAPTALSDSMWLVKASALTWTTMTSATNEAAWVDNTVRTTTSATYQTAPLDTSKYPQGKYRLYARVAQSAGVGCVKESERDTAVSVTRTTPHLVAVADVELPCRDSAYGTAANLTLSVKSDGTNTLTVDAFLLMPLSWGSFSWHHSTVTAECDQLDVGPSGVFVDGLCDTTYLRGGVLVPKVLAGHVVTQVATASPTGNTWPSDWYRSDISYVSADTARIKIAATGTGRQNAAYSAATATNPLVVAGAWYEFSFTRQVTSFTSGGAEAYIRWQDIDGNTVREDILSTVAATDAAPVAVTVYAKAPVHAVRAFLNLGVVSASTLTVYYSAVSFRRCPLRLIVVAEDAAGAVTSYRHPTHLTVKYTPRYQVAR